MSKFYAHAKHLDYFGGDLHSHRVTLTKSNSRPVSSIAAKKMYQKILQSDKIHNQLTQCNYTSIPHSSALFNALE